MPTLKKTTKTLAIAWLALPFHANAHQSVLPHPDIANDYWHALFSQIIGLGILGLFAFLLTRWLIQRNRHKQ